MPASAALSGHWGRCQLAVGAVGNDEFSKGRVFLSANSCLGTVVRLSAGVASLLPSGLVANGSGDGKRTCAGRAGNDCLCDGKL